MKPEKRFKTPDELLDILEARGLVIEAREEAKASLRRIGYHRLAGYRYPFRQMIAGGTAVESPKQYRLDQHVAGATFDTVLAYYDFDAQLRNLFQRGLEGFEVALRSGISDALARRDPHAHLKISCLDEGRCNKRLKGKNGVTSLDAFRQEIAKITRRLLRGGDDFAVHHSVLYNSDLPVWAIVENLDFGMIEHLYRHMKDEDRRDVSRQFGVLHPRDFSVLIKAMRELRNLVAHAARVYNKPLKTRIKIPGRSLARPHWMARALGEGSRPPANRIYTHAAFLSYMLKYADSRTRWPADYAELSLLFPEADPSIPEANRQSLGKTMGFPPCWESAELWQRN